MHPEIFGFIKSWGLLLAISFLVGAWLCVRRGRARGIHADSVLDLVFVVLVSSIIGVRLFYVITHPGEFAAGGQFDPWYRAFFVWDSGGLTLYGGIIAATLAVWWQTRRRGIPFLTMADIMAPALMLGIGITRIGCFLAGCCFGNPTTCPVGVHFPHGSLPSRTFGDVAIHPAQLYASALAFLVFGILLIWERRPSPSGATFFRFLLLYGAARFVLDLTRYYETEQVWLGLSNNQWISLVMVVAGATALLLKRRETARV
ncbi:MAG: prolipoprotein diacylglyceryl transferase [Candidatus Krumholzibacteriia bacterium]